MEHVHGLNYVAITVRTWSLVGGGYKDGHVSFHSCLPGSIPKIPFLQCVPRDPMIVPSGTDHGQGHLFVLLGKTYPWTHWPQCH